MISFGKCGLALLLLLGGIRAAGEEADLKYFPFVKTVRMSAAAVEGGMGAVIGLDTEALSHIGNPLRECRVFTDSGLPVRFAVRVSEGEVRRTRLEPIEAYLAMTGENTGVIKTRDGLPPGPFCMEVRPENPYYAKFLTVTCKMLSGKDRVVLDKASLFSFSPPYPLTGNVVEFLAPAQSELHVSWAPGGEIPQKILRPDHAIPEAWSEPELENVRIRLYRKVTYKEIVPLTARYTPELQVNHVENISIYSLQMPRVPVTGFRMQTGTPFLFRQAKVLGGSSPVDLRLVAEGSFTRVSPGDPLLLTIPESRFRYYEIHLDNREQSPLDDVSWQAEGPKLELVTEAPSENLLKLAYGRKTTAGILPRSLPDKKVNCLLGKGRRNPVFVPPAQQGLSLFWYVLDGVLLLLPVAGGAGWLCYRRKRKKKAAA